jgi:uncharacterized protein
MGFGPERVLRRVEGLLKGNARNPMISDADRKIVEELKDRLLTSNGDRIMRVILYGSRASGRANAHSDFDLLVVQAGPVAKREEMVRLRHALGDVPYAVDIWVMSEEEFEETKNVIGGLAYPALKYGLVLHENA